MKTFRTTIELNGSVCFGNRGEEEFTQELTMECVIEPAQEAVYSYQNCMTCDAQSAYVEDIKSFQIDGVETTENELLKKLGSNLYNSILDYVMNPDNLEELFKGIF